MDEELVSIELVFPTIFEALTSVDIRRMFADARSREPRAVLRSQVGAEHIMSQEYRVREQHMMLRHCVRVLCTGSGTGAWVTTSGLPVRN